MPGAAILPPISLPRRTSPVAGSGTRMNAWNRLEPTPERCPPLDRGNQFIDKEIATAGGRPACGSRLPPPPPGPRGAVEGRAFKRIEKNP